MTYKQEHKSIKSMMYCDGSVCDIQRNQQVSTEELLALDVDILVLAALENQVHKDNGGSIKAGMYWEEQEVNERLKKKIDRQANAIFDLAEEKKISLRTAAYLIGVQRIAGAITEQGTREYFQNVEK